MTNTQPSTMGFNLQTSQVITGHVTARPLQCCINKIRL